MGCSGRCGGYPVGGCRALAVYSGSQNFHDVTLVDMGDVPESSVSIPELSSLRQLWPPAVLGHMVWLQQELEGMRAEAKQRFRQTRPSSCIYCGTWIKCDMYRHVAKFHLDLAQLWRCPVSWVTVWKAHHKIVWTMFGGHMVFHGTLSLEHFFFTVDSPT